MLTKTQQYYYRNQSIEIVKDSEYKLYEGRDDSITF